MRKLLLCATEHPSLTIGLCLLAVFVLLNLLAFRHAWTMTHFAAGPARRNEPPVRGSLLERARLAVNGIAVGRPTEAARPDHLNLPYELHVFAGAVGRLAAWNIPRQPAAGRVLLFHGYSAGKARLLPEARMFRELGYACFLVDFRGSGESDGDRTSIGYHEADDVERAVAYVRERWPGEPLVLFGQSMGAVAVLRALACRPLDVDAVVLECPFDRLLSTVEARFAATGLPSFPAARLMVFWGGVQHGFNGFGHNPVEYARRVTRPTLLMHGTSDVRVSCRQVESIYENLRGEKRLHFFPGLGHESYAANRPEEWRECVAAFLASRAAVE